MNLIVGLILIIIILVSIVYISNIELYTSKKNHNKINDIVINN
jgi:hypothetical protein